MLGDGHFGHVRFKNFVNFDFDGHLVQDRFGEQRVIVMFVTRSCWNRCVEFTIHTL